MPRSPPIQRRFVDLGAHAVHYRRAGRGPCVVLVHQSPQSSAALVQLIRLLAKDFTVFAFDTPGCGASDPLPRKSPTIRHFADSLARTFEAVGLKKVGLFGSKTGACIALEFSRRYPEKVRGLVLDSLPVFTPVQVRGMTSVMRSDDKEGAYYLMPFKPKWDGSHLASTWSHVRDHVTWFPWYERKAANRRNIDMPWPEAMHEGVMDNFRAGDDLSTVVEAAFRYKPKKAIAELSVPVVFTAREEDMLFPCLDMLPALRARQRIVPLGRDMAAYRAAIQGFLKPFSAGRSPVDPAIGEPPKKTIRAFADLSSGSQVLLRIRNAGALGRPLVLLHDGPGSGLSLMGLAESLPCDRPIYVPDIPGNGDSDPLPGKKNEIRTYGTRLIQALGRLDLRSVDLFGRGSGAAVALAITVARPSFVHRLILHDLPLLTAVERARFSQDYTPPIEPTWDGGHLYKAWLMLRDDQIYWPWFDRRSRTIRPIDFEGNPGQLHERLFEVLKARRSYGQTTQAAFRYQTHANLKRVACPTLMIERDGDAFAGRHEPVVSNLQVITTATIDRSETSFKQEVESFLEPGCRV